LAAFLAGFFLAMTHCRQFYAVLHEHISVSQKIRARRNRGENFFRGDVTTRNAQRP
jgi:hypothetical protein